MSIQPSGRVVIVGAGMVGSSVAYAILNQQIAKEILIIDIAEDLVRAHVLDMQDASQFTNGVKVTAASYSDLEDGDVVIVTCGAAQKEGQTRIDLLKINASIIRSVVASIKQTGKQVYLLMVTNPVDIMTYIAVKESGLPKGMVFGSGTYLDTGRLKMAIEEQIDVNHNSIHAYVIGEHGDSSFPLLSSATVSGVGLETLMKVDEQLYTSLMEKVRGKAYEIIKGKKATYFGIGNAVAVIARAIIRDEQRVMPLSVLLEGQYGHSDLCIGVPSKIGSAGCEVVGEAEFNDQESELFEKSAGFLKENLKLI
jgi:L-lactate dehydrogenase